jgi:hypothetical protein
VQSEQPNPAPGATGGAPVPGTPATPARRRANRIAFTSAAAGLLAVAVVAAGTALASAGSHPSGHQPGAAPAARAAAVARQHKLLQSRKAKSQTAPPANPAPPKPYGAVISTGIQTKSGELVFYAVHIHVKQLPKTTFGIMGGFRNSAGHLSAAVEANEFSGPDVAEGFHAIEAPISGVPEFGYYAGPAAKITGSVGGRTIQASLAHWSVNPKVVIFWFSPKDDPKGLDVTSPAAFDAQGKQLPPGHDGIGHG